jgi:hypothetical protein
LWAPLVLYWRVSRRFVGWQMTRGSGG